MKNKIVIACISLLMHATIAFSQQTESITQKTDSLLTDAFHKGIFSGLVIVSHNGTEFYFKGLGYADWQTKRTLDRNTLFNIGSLNKQFTEEIIHQLVKEQKLSYDDPLSKYLAGFPSGDKITIQELLDMKAGLGDFLEDPKFDEIQSHDFSLTDLIGIIRNEPLLFEPGTNREYSNSGYAVLGAVIEKITGMTYTENLTRRIVNPLGLTNIFYTKAEKEKQTNRAFGTDIDFEGNKKSIDDISNSSPAGGAYTNIDNLLRFAEAKLQSKLPSGKTYGTGMFAGGTPFWNSVIYYNEKNGFSFVVMANTGSIADEIAHRLSSIIKNESYPPLELPFEMTFYKIISEKGFGYVRTNVKQLAAQARLPYDDRFLNFFGYKFLVADKTDIAINLFKMNVDLFPKVANTYDSLAEVYLKSGDRKNALHYYKMELQFDPHNERVKKAVANLESGK